MLLRLTDAPRSFVTDPVFIRRIVENLVGLFISTNAIVVAPFLAILITLIVRPQGILGGKPQVKKV